MHDVSVAVSAWLAAGEAPVVVRAPVAIGTIRGPAGLDLGAVGPAEVAVSICAEVLTARTGRDPLVLSVTSGSIHP